MFVSRTGRCDSGATLTLRIALCLVSGACTGESEANLRTWIAEHDTIGDTIVVRTVSGSVWGSPATLVEEVAIGMLEGPDELMFGRISDLAVDSVDGVYVFDGQARVLRYYDREGNYVRTLGREGSGPGEYRDASLGMAVRRDGRLVMRDPRNGRLNLYDTDGSPWASWPVPSSLFTARAMVLDTADHAYLKVMLGVPTPGAPMPIGLLHLDERGEIVDTIGDPWITNAPTARSPHTETCT